MQTVINGRGTQDTKGEEKGIGIGAPLFPTQLSLSYACFWREMITTLKDQAVQHECLRNKTKNIRSVFCYAERTPLFKLKQFTHSCQEKVVVIVILLRSRQAFHGRNKVGPQCLRKRFGTFDLPQIQQIFLNTANIFSRKLTHQPNHQQNDAKHDLGERN